MFGIVFAVAAVLCATKGLIVAFSSLSTAIDKAKKK